MRLAFWLATSRKNFSFNIQDSIQPMVQLIQNDSLILKNVSLKEASVPNVINHKLQRTQQGWFITDQNGAASIYRSQPFNSTTLTLTSNASVAVNLWVF